ncbi:hypothetical protein B0H63DRAFT_454457 [Podospora didyma]|uniref:Uncharacterized protein n=1 Tax=Podospora didyma TaxID=330526 RepID=A0AAE0K6L6_9PEZI|nr:hypothetical protein B0H63DRAFT_454457 [Podospora didyma]
MATNAAPADKINQDPRDRPTSQPRFCCAPPRAVHRSTFLTNNTYAVAERRDAFYFSRRPAWIGDAETRRGWRLRQTGNGVIGVPLLALFRLVWCPSSGHTCHTQLMMYGDVAFKEATPRLPLQVTTRYLARPMELAIQVPTSDSLSGAWSGVPADIRYMFSQLKMCPGGSGRSETDIASSASIRQSSSHGRQTNKAVIRALMSRNKSELEHPPLLLLRLELSAPDHALEPTRPTVVSRPPGPRGVQLEAEPQFPRQGWGFLGPSSVSSTLLAGPKSVSQGRILLWRLHSCTAQRLSPRTTSGTIAPDSPEGAEGEYFVR